MSENENVRQRKRVEESTVKSSKDDITFDKDDLRSRNRSAGIALS
jgi:hypothetical protein